MPEEQERAVLFPEAVPRTDIPDGTWTVEDGFMAMTRLREREMRAPHHTWMCPCGHDHAEALRLHEMGHLAFTPANHAEQAARAKLPQNLVHAVEDIRVQARTMRAGFPIDAMMCPDTVTRQLDYLLGRKDYAGLITAMASLGSSQTTEAVMMDWVNSVHRASRCNVDGAPPVVLAMYLTYAARIIHDFAYPVELHPFRETLKVAQRLLQYSEDMQQAEQEQAERAAERKKRQQEWQKEVKNLLDIKGMPPLPTKGDVLWGDLLFERPPLTRPARVQPGRKWTSRDEGVLPQSMHRIATDGRIFKQPAHRGPGAAVLVDASGSMGWDAESLQAVLDTVPGATVAVYSGNEKDGVLRIVAKNGRKAEEQWTSTRPGEGSNCVDGPALRWLATQKGQRLWLSDGNVTGVGDSSSYGLRADAATVCAVGRIMRVHSFDKLMRVVHHKDAFLPQRSQKGMALTYDPSRHDDLEGNDASRYGEDD